MEKHTRKVSIIGGGIGGLTAVWALQCQGIGVTVFERNPGLREIEAGLTRWASVGAGLAEPGSGRYADCGQYSPRPL